MSVQAWAKKLKNNVVGVLTQGISPRLLTWSLVLGFSVGLFPVLGTTMFLSGFVGLVLKLNQPALQVANLIATPLEVACIPLFKTVGERLVGPLADPEELTGVAQSVMRIGGAVVHAVIGWVVSLPFIILAFYIVLAPIVPWAIRTWKGKEEPGSSGDGRKKESIALGSPRTSDPARS